jgi:chromosome segregation ATPase
MHSGTGQEMALKARLNRLRESVQREALRLEFLRQERAREETRKRGGATGDAHLREHDRQLESKVHHDEERLAGVERQLEIAKVEEEKRRERIAELEHKLDELHADIAEAEGRRSDARQQVDLLKLELKNYEAGLDRAKKVAH